MERRDFLPSSPTIVVERKPVQSLVANGNPLSKDVQQPSFADTLQKAYGDFTKLKMHADLHPSEYQRTINLINELPVQLQDKLKLLRLCLWNQYGSSIFGEIFNLTPDKILGETAVFSDLPDELTNMVSELLEEGGDEDEEEIEKNITSRPISKHGNIRVNPEQRDFVILAEGGSKWKTLTDNQKLVLTERYLADLPDSTPSIAKRLGITSARITQIEARGLRKLGFFGEPISLTRQQLQNIFQNATEDDINSLTPKERELLERLYGKNINSQRSQPTINSATTDLKICGVVTVTRHQNAMQKLLHTKRPIRIDRSLSPTPEQVGFIKTNYLDMSIVAMAKQTGKNPRTITRWLRDVLEIPIGNTSRTKWGADLTY